MRGVEPNVLFGLEQREPRVRIVWIVAVLGDDVLLVRFGKPSFKHAIEH